MEEIMKLDRYLRECNNDTLELCRRFATRLQWSKQYRICKQDASYILGNTINRLVNKPVFVDSFFYVFKSETIEVSNCELQDWYQLEEALYTIRRFEIPHHLRNYENPYENYPSRESYLQALKTAGELAAKLQPHGDPNNPINSDFSLWVDPHRGALSLR